MSFKFIDKDYTGVDAASGTEDDEYDLQGIFYNQVKDQRFKLGNTGASSTDFQVTVSGSESDITDAVTFSYDNGANFYTSVTISGVEANQVTDPIICRFTCPDDLITTSGTFLIRVDEV